MSSLKINAFDRLAVISIINLTFSANVPQFKNC